MAVDNEFCPQLTPDFELSLLSNPHPWDPSMHILLTLRPNG